MFLNQFYTEIDQQIIISATQASLFAKEIAQDFNPLHDPDSKRFCVPGDLLFAIIVAKYGLSAKMEFTFSGMVGHNIPLNFPVTAAENFDITDDKGKVYLKVRRNGQTINTENIMAKFIREYVAFSGPNFPHVLVPLMAEHNVMINTLRPLVIYESMSFEFSNLEFNTPKLKATNNNLNINGKRGNAQLHFQVIADNKIIATGFKKLLISGIKNYDKVVINNFVEQYLTLQANYTNTP